MCLNCDLPGNDCFPALVPDAIKAVTFQWNSIPLNTHMKMLWACKTPLSLPLQTFVIDSTFSDQAAVCIFLQVFAPNVNSGIVLGIWFAVVSI